MKIDVHYVFGNTLRKNSHTFKRVCSYPLLNISSTYAGLLGFLGVVSCQNIIIFVSIVMFPFFFSF